MDLLAALLTTAPLAHFDSALFRDLAPELEERHLGVDEILFSQGDPGDSLYGVITGVLEVLLTLADGSVMAIDELHPGITVGEMALLTGHTRSATLRALQPCQLVRLPRAGFLRLMEAHPAIAAAFANAIVPRFQRTELAGVLGNLLGDLGRAALHAIQTELQWHHFDSGAVVMRQGEPGEALYIVLSGRLSVTVTDADGTVRAVGEVGRGESVGELALLTGAARAATVYALRDTELVSLSKESFERLMDIYPQAMLRITQLIVRRLQRTIRAPIANHTTVTFALVPLHAGAPVAALAAQLRDVFNTFGPTLHLNATELDRHYGHTGTAHLPEDHPTRALLHGWLDAQEAAYRYVLYEADAVDSPWTRRCLQHADRVVLVGEATQPVPTHAPPRYLQPLRGTDRQELVLIQPADIARPSGTRQWLAAYGNPVHHHVRLSVPEDGQRCARRLTGRAVGLVLGGGGARGFAHIGVLRALEEAGLAVDMVGGTSMGALIGAGHALGWGYPALLLFARQFASTRAVFDYTLPLLSFFASGKVTRLLQMLFGQTYIEDLWRPYFCMSTNLTQARPNLHRQGLLWAAVRASSAIPGLFSPMLDHGNVLVDGTILNSLPIDVMRAQCGEGLLLAVNVSLEQDLTTAYNFGDHVSGWRLLWNRLNPFAPRIHAPSLFALLLRVNEVNGVYQKRAQQHLADIYIRPAVETVGMLSFDAYAEIIELGYAAARRAVAEFAHRDQP